MAHFHPIQTVGQRPVADIRSFSHFCDRMISATANVIAVLKGFVLSTLVAAIIASVGFTLVAVIGGADGCCRIGFDRATGEALSGQILFFGLFAAAGMTVFAGPLTLALKKRHLERAWTYSISGFVIGYAIALMLLMPGRGAWPRVFTASWWLLLGAMLLSMTTFGVAGAAAGLVWWRSYRRSLGRPEKT